MPGSTLKTPWGDPPWRIDILLLSQANSQEVDFRRNRRWIHSLSAAAWLRRFEPSKTVALSNPVTSVPAQAATLGDNSGKTAAGDLPA